MTINFKAPEIKELQPRLLVLGVGGAGGNAFPPAPPTPKTSSRGCSSFISGALKLIVIFYPLLFVMLKLPFKITTINICFFSRCYLKFFKCCWFPYLKCLALTNKQHAIFYFCMF